MFFGGAVRSALSENCSSCVKENSTQSVFKMVFRSFSDDMFSSYMSVTVHYLESNQKIKD